MRLLVPLAARRSRPRAHALGGCEGRHRPLPARPARTRSTSPTSAPRCSEDEHRGRGRRSAAGLELGGRADRAHRLREATAQESRAALRGVRRVRAEPQPVLVVPGYATFHEPELRARAELGAASGSASPAGSTTTCSTASTAQLRASSFPRSPRASACRSSTRSCAARRLPARTPRRCRRWRRRRPLLRPDRRRSYDTAIERCSRMRRSATGSRAQVRERARTFSWERSAQATLESYCRAASASARS